MDRDLSMICTYLRNDGSSKQTLEEGKVCTLRRKKKTDRMEEPGAGGGSENLLNVPTLCVITQG